jgi:hypothetical protein
VLIVVVFAILALGLITLSYRVHAKTEQRIQDRLRTHYAPKTVEIEERDDWHNGGGDFSFGGSVCFRVRVTNDINGSVSTIIVLIDSDSDGGHWNFAGEYASMDACKAKYWRG